MRRGGGNMHPRAFPGKSGALGMKAGDRICYMPDGCCGIADEFLSDGDVLMTWDDGTFGIVKWNNLSPLRDSFGCAN